MKALIYLAGLIAVGVIVTWLAFGITPQNQWNWIRGYTMNTSATISEKISETGDSASKLKNTLGKHFDDAADVYEGKEKKDPFQYNPTDVDDSKIKKFQ